MKLPSGFIDKYSKLLGDEFKVFLDTFDDQATSAYRQEKTISHTVDNGKIFWTSNGHYGKVDGHSDDHVSGAIYSQEPTAQFVGEVVNAKPGEKILDLAAAPGGKTTHIAHQMQGEGILIANEIIPKRAKILSQNIERLGVKNAIVLNHSSEQLSKKFENYFDQILVDAPCSGEGMFRKDPESIKFWHEKYAEENSIRQKEILAEAMKMLKPGGKITYSTCTFSPEENEQVISWLADNYQLEIDPIEKKDGISDGKPEWSDGNQELKNTARLWPHILSGEGQFVAKLSNKKKQETDSRNDDFLISNVSDAATKEWTEFRENNLVNFSQRKLFSFGETLFDIPFEVPAQVSSLKIIRMGIELGQNKKNRFIPSHSLALSLSGKNDVKQRYILDESEYKLYVHGDTITAKNTNGLVKGWTLMIAPNGHPVGWGNFVDGIIKNFFPKGLRFQTNNSIFSNTDDI